jgi:hypothetical protein
MWSADSHAGGHATTVDTEMVQLVQIGGAGRPEAVTRLFVTHEYMLYGWLTRRSRIRLAFLECMVDVCGRSNRWRRARKGVSACCTPKPRGRQLRGCAH